MPSIYLSAIGCVSPLGLGAEAIVKAKARGLSCPLGPPPLASLAERCLPPAGWISEIPRPERWLGRPLRFARLDRLAQLALVAAHEAARLGGWITPERALRAGVALGTAGGSHLSNELFQDELAQGPAGASPALFAYTLPSAATGEISIHLGLGGPALTLAQGADSGLAAVATACQLLTTGQVRWMLAGAADVLGATLLANTAGQPLPLAEGAAFFLLQADEPAGALARVTGWATARGESALERAHAAALAQAGVAGQAAQRWPTAAPAQDPWLTSLGNSLAAAPLLAAAGLLTGGEVSESLAVGCQDPAASQASAICLTAAATP